jgi:hypothetical protein
MQPCRGRLATIELPGTKTPIAFERRPEDKKPILFSAPKACTGTSATDLCESCASRKQRTEAVVEARAGKYIANQQNLLHGLFGEPIPEWSHMFGSRWFLETQAQKNLVIPAAVTAILPKSCVEDPVEMPRGRPKVGEPSVQPVAETEPSAQPPKKRGGGRKPKAVVAPAEPTVQPSPPLEPTAPPTVSPPPKKFAAKKKAAAGAPLPTLGVIQPHPLEEVEVVKISVRKIVIDDRMVYLSSEKDKVYDLKFKYIGRYNRRDDRVESKYPDSDRD